MVSITRPENIPAGVTTAIPFLIHKQINGVRNADGLSVTNAAHSIVSLLSKFIELFIYTY
jgi:hypothetical protein